MGRPKIYANDAERMAAYRAKNFRVDLTLDKVTGETLTKISGVLGLTPSQLIDGMIKFALTNRDWQKVGLMPRSK